MNWLLSWLGNLGISKTWTFKGLPKKDPQDRCQNCGAKREDHETKAHAFWEKT